MLRPATLIVIGVLLFAVLIGWSLLRDDMSVSTEPASTTVQATPTLPLRTPVPTSGSLDTPSDLTPEWTVYRNEEYGFSFRYPPSWSLSSINTGSGYDGSKPYLLIWAGRTSDAPCDDLGCPPRTGDRDELKKGYTLEGGPPLNPWFDILRVRGDTWVSLSVIDVTIECASQIECDEYVAVAPFSDKVRVNDSRYRTYNDFLTLIDTLEFSR